MYSPGGVGIEDGGGNVRVENVVIVVTPWTLPLFAGIPVARTSVSIWSDAIENVMVMVTGLFELYPDWMSNEAPVGTLGKALSGATSVLVHTAIIAGAGVEDGVDDGKLGVSGWFVMAQLITPSLGFTLTNVEGPWVTVIGCLAHTLTFARACWQEIS